MASAFHIKEHVVEGQYIREYPRATAHSQEEVLYLAVKQYVPKSNPNPQPGDVTIIGAHANGFPKEIYEPMWEDLVAELGKRNVRVRGIWIADVAWQGQSGVINEKNLGNDPSWFDHSRDLLHMINHFRRDMPRPLIGVGHSFGGAEIVKLSLMHPRLLSSVVLLDAVLSSFHILDPSHEAGTGKAKPSFQNRDLWPSLATTTASFYRRDLWPSRAEAEASFRRSKFYATWDPRVLEAWIAHGVRATPTAAYPDQKDAGKATLTTTKHQECFTYYRPKEQGRDPQTGRPVLDMSLLVDAGPEVAQFPEFPFYRPEGPETTARLPYLRPGALYIFGATSVVCTPDARQEKMDLTGTAVGGSGGVAKGRVRQVVVEGHGHLVPMEVPRVCAEHAAAFLAEDLKHWREEEEAFRKWAAKPDREKQTLGEDWKGWIGPPLVREKL